MNTTLKDGHNVFYVLYVLGFLFALSLALPIYINSTFLSEFLPNPDKYVGIIYAAGSVLTLISLLFAPKILQRFGNFKTTAALALLEVVLMLMLAISRSAIVAIPVFITYTALLSVMFLNFDVFLEHYSSDKKTGSIRGIFLTITNVAFLISPVIAGFILTNGDYWKIYSLSAFFMLTVFVLLAQHFSKFKDVVYDRVPFWSTFKEVYGQKNLFNIFMSNMLLKFFFAWMVIYTPIYLNEYIGFTWSEIGLILMLMLLPFVLFEIPAGKLADSKWGEKEFLTIGFIIMGISTIGLVFLSEPVLWIWATALFVTRIGASLVEIMTESYFFKHVDDSDAHIMGFYRNTRPIAYIIAPLIATLALAFVSFKFLFPVLGILMLVGVKYSLALKDTR